MRTIFRNIEEKANQYQEKTLESNQRLFLYIYIFYYLAGHIFASVLSVLSITMKDRVSISLRLGRCLTSKLFDSKILFRYFPIEMTEQNLELKKVSS